VVDELGVDRPSRSALIDGDRGGSASQIAGRIRDAVAGHAGDGPPLDDQTVLVVRRTKGA
jgi:hypothetical protein